MEQSIPILTVSTLSPNKPPCSQLPLATAGLFISMPRRFSHNAHRAHVL